MCELSPRRARRRPVVAHRQARASTRCSPVTPPVSTRSSADGTDKDLAASLTSTMKRLGGTGLDKEADRRAVRVPRRSCRRRALSFARHRPSRSRQRAVRFGWMSRLPRRQRLQRSGSSSLRGKRTGSTSRHAARSEDAEPRRPRGEALPYYHDGSAATLEALLHDRGAVHGMVEDLEARRQAGSPTSLRSSRRSSARAATSHRPREPRQARGFSPLRAARSTNTLSLPSPMRLLARRDAAEQVHRWAIGGGRRRGLARAAARSPP